MVVGLLPAFFVVALLYAAAGFGGGSSYLALLALAALPTNEMRLTALVCNIVVAGGGVWRFGRAGLLPWRRALPLVLCSVPLAYLGGRISLTREMFLGVLGGILLLAGIAMWLRDGWQPPVAEEKNDHQKPAADELGASALLGSGLGFLAGLVSIGGGIFLSPILFLRRWGSARTIAAVTSLFILVNSVAGLIGQLSTGANWPPTWLGWLVLAVFVGGQIGSRLTVERLSPVIIRRTAAILIVVVGIRLLWQVIALP